MAKQWTVKKEKSISMTNPNTADKKDSREKFIELFRLYENSIRAERLCRSCYTKNGDTAVK